MDVLHCLCVWLYAFHDQSPLTSGHSDLVPVSASFDPSTLGDPDRGCCGSCQLGVHCVELPGLGAELCDLKPAGSGVPGFLQLFLTLRFNECLFLAGNLSGPFTPPQ